MKTIFLPAASAAAMIALLASCTTNEPAIEEAESDTVIVTAQKAQGPQPGAVMGFSSPRSSMMMAPPPEPQITEQYEETCLLYTSPSPRDLSTSRMPSSA